MNDVKACINELSAMAVVICKSKILTTNEIIYGNETLSLPKGHKEENESLIEAAIRECYEETGVVINVNDLKKELSHFSYEFQTPSKNRIKKTIAPFLFELSDESAPCPKEKRILSVKWMDIDEFIKKCSHDNVRAVVMDIK